MEVTTKMADDKVQDYLNKGMYGVMETKPDERRIFLGSLRERTYLLMTKDELLSNNYLEALTKEIQKHPGNQLLLNGTIKIGQLTPYIQLANKTNTAFTIVNQTNDASAALIYTAKVAIHEEIIDVAEKYPLITSTEAEKPKKKSIFTRLFHSES